MRLIATLALLYLPVTAFGQKPVTLKNFEAALEKLQIQATAAIQRIESQAEVQRKEVEATFDKEANAIRTDFLARIHEFQVESTKAGDLDSALTARDEKQKLAAMNLAFAVKTKSAARTEEAPAKPKDSKENTQANQLDKAIFAGPWVSQRGDRVVFNDNGTTGRGHSWKFDPRTNQVYVRTRDNGRSEYKVFLDGRFLDGHITEAGGTVRRVWLVKVP